MTGQNRIIAFGSGGGDNAADELKGGQGEDKELLLTDSVEETTAWVDEDALEGESSREGFGLSWLPPVLAGAAAVAWTGFFGWAHWSQLQTDALPADWAALITDWSVPILLIGVAWLLAMRNSRREAIRFGDAARLLSAESAQLETRLLTVNRELSLAREFIAAQSRDLEALGRIAADRLSENADRLQELIRGNGERVETLGSVSEAALENMEKLRGQLPVIASSAKDVTNNIGNAGRTAHAQIEEMVAGFKRLNEFGQACSGEVLNLRKHTSETIGEFQRHCDQMAATAATRFAALNEQGAEFRTRLETQEVEALAAIRSRAAALGEELAETKQLLESEEEERLDSIKARLSALREEGSAVSRSLLDSERQALQGWKSGLAAFEAERSELFAAIEEAQSRMTETAQAQMRDVASDAARIESQLAQGSRTFAEGLEQLREETEAGNREWIASLSERLDTLSREIAGRGQLLGEELDHQHEELQARHDRALAELSRKCTTLGSEVSNAASAVLSQIEQHQGRIGEGHARLLEDLSRRFEALEAETAERSQRVTDEIERRRDEFTAGEEQAVAGLRELLAAMDQEIAQRLARHQQQGSAISRKASEVTAELEASGQRLAELAEQGDAAQQRIRAGLQSITSDVSQAQSLVGRAESDIAELTDASVRLLELLQASAKNSSIDLPEALNLPEQRLAALDDRITQMRQTLEQAGDRSEAIAGRIAGSEQALHTLIAKADALHQALQGSSSEHAETFAGLLHSLKELDSQSEQLAFKAREELTQALEKLSQSARDAVSTIGETGAASVSELAGRLGAESGEAIERAIHAATAEASGKLEQAAAHAAGVSREATIQLRDQLTKVNELVGNLEQRVAQARTRAEEQVDNDFARRVALITESLNSNAIDIAKALSTEVSDTAWAAYLRGDRGIFTRRAVGLIDASEAKAIQQIFERDQDFREHVSRYIHDFEAILRQVLSTRDGHALGVTLLSSDMGKLYVALAQGIERLRE